MSDSERTSDEASPAAAEVAVEPSEEAETEFHPFDEIAEDFKPSPTVRVLDGEGLPVTVDSGQRSDIPPLSPSTLVCMADTSAFVVRNNWGEEILRFNPGVIERAADGRWRIRRHAAQALCLAEIQAWRLARQESSPLTALEKIDAHVFALLLGLTSVSSLPDYILVEPIRPACKHYVRQKLAFDLNAQHVQFARLCSARRTTEGTFMTVRDTGVWACDMRDPFDAETAKALDRFDAEKVEQGKKREHLPIFGGPGGIFESKREGA